MKTKNITKILFDVLFLFVFCLLYQLNSSGEDFHGVIAFAVLILCAIHLMYNRKWIVAVGKRFFEKGFSAKQKFSLVLFILMLIFMLITFVSGIILVNHLGDKEIWRPIHFSLSILLLCTIAAHVFVHMRFIKNSLARKSRTQNKLLSKVAPLLVTAIIISAGIAGTATVIAPVISKTFQTEHSQKNEDYNKSEIRWRSMIINGLLCSAAVLMWSVPLAVVEKKQRQN
jgi:cytochrome b561